MKKKIGIDIPMKELEKFCISNHILKMSLFGSVLKSSFKQDSDVDLLVEFDLNHVPSFFGLADMQFELEELLGRRVDLRTPNELSIYFRDTVLEEAKRLYG